MKRNATLEFIKLAAAIFVVFIHFRLPGNIGGIVNCMARFAVPLFMAVAGYYSYGATPEKLKKRTVKLLTMLIGAEIVYFAYGIWQTAFSGSDIGAYLTGFAKLSTLAKLIYGNLTPIGYHLWYLAAVLVSYILLYGYTCLYSRNERPVNYKPLYYIACGLIVFNITLSVLLPMGGVSVGHTAYRNALLTGLPMVIVGIFVRQYQDKLVKAFNFTVAKGLFIILICVLLSLLQWFGLGVTELPIATMVEAAVILLLAGAYGHAGNRFVAALGRLAGDLSKNIYLYHLLIGKLLVTLAKKYEVLRTYTAEFRLPFVVAALSIALGLILYIPTALKQKKKNNQ